MSMQRTATQARKRAETENQFNPFNYPHEEEEKDEMGWTDAEARETGRIIDEYNARVRAAMLRDFPAWARALPPHAARKITIADQHDLEVYNAHLLKLRNDDQYREQLCKDPDVLDTDFIEDIDNCEKL